MRALSVACAALLAAAPAYASVDAGLSQTFGSNHYRGTRIWAGVGDDWHLKPALSVYRSDLSNGTYKTLSARGGYDAELWGAGLTLGGSPKTNGYSNRFFGLDATVSLTPGAGGPSRAPGPPEGKAPRDEGSARVEVGGALFHTTHKDEFQLAPAAPRAGRPGRGGLTPRAAAVSIGQTDLSVNGAVSLFAAQLFAEWTVSRYDKDLSAFSAAPAAAPALAGLGAIIQGFPKTSAVARLDLGMFPVVEPFLSVARTTFHLGAPAATALTAGVSANFDPVQVHGSVERYFPGGGASAQTYVSLGAGVRF